MIVIKMILYLIQKTLMLIDTVVFKVEIRFLNNNNKQSFLFFSLSLSLFFLLTQFASLSCMSFQIIKKVPLYSSSNVIKARQSHIENKRERCRRRRRNRKREKTQRIFLRLLSSSSRDDDIIKKNNNENTFLFFLSTFFMLMLTRMTLGPPSAHMHLFNDLTR